LEADGLRSSLSGAQTRFERGQALLAAPNGIDDGLRAVGAGRQRLNEPVNLAAEPVGVLAELRKLDVGDLRTRAQELPHVAERFGDDVL
jgi:hypothetical protein